MPRTKPKRPPEPVVKPDPDAEVLTQSEAAYVARCSPRTIRRLIADGEIEGACVRGKAALVRRTDLLRWLGVEA